MTYDAIIVGGGIIGCTTAYFLAQQGMKPAIVEHADIGGGTTSNSFAWANGATKTKDSAYHRLNADGVQGYRALMDQFGADRLGINPAGSLQIVRQSDGAGHRAMQADAKALSGFGYPCQLLDHAALCAREPALRFMPDTQALYCPSDLIIDAPRFARCMADQVTALGGAVIRGRATALLADDTGKVSGLKLGDRTLTAPNVILACGPDTAAILGEITGFDGFTTRFPLRKVPGLLLTTPPLDPAPLSRLIYTSTTNELHMLAAENGGLRIGSDDVDGMIWDDQSKATMLKAGAALLQRAAAFIPDLLDRVDPGTCRLGIGVRPFPEDGKSIAGPLPGADGLYVIATHSGVTLAPVLGALMAETLAKGMTPEQLAPYSLTRFAGFGP